MRQVIGKSRTTLIQLALTLVACGAGSAGCRPAVSTSSIACPAVEKRDTATTVVAVDLDCDGGEDTVRVVWMKTGVQRPALVVAGAHLKDTLLLDVEGTLPDVLAFGDLQGDGTRDVLLALADESTVLPVVVLVSRDGLRAATPAPTLAGPSLQFRWDSSEAEPGCLERLLPRLEARPGRTPAVVAAVGSAEEHGCASPPTVTLEVRRDTLFPVGAANDGA
jgi:hypothetical protein